MSKVRPATPIIDLFAGPGGLGEGFSRRRDTAGRRKFEIVLSIEKDPRAHQTLELRAFYRQFSPESIPDEYYQYLWGDITREELFEIFPEKSARAQSEARCLTLGEDNIVPLVKKALKGKKSWVLIGGPPCQAYSLVGRSRMSGAGLRREGESKKTYSLRLEKQRLEFENDHRHLLYREYLSVIASAWPPIFVMENVKGILSAKLDGKRIFPSILRDLTNPRKALGQPGKRFRYKIHSLVEDKVFSGDPSDESINFLIKSENYGVPQKRHRVILVGVRDDLDSKNMSTLMQSIQISVKETIGNLPKLTSGLSKGKNESPFAALSRVREELEDIERSGFDQTVLSRMKSGLRSLRKEEARGSRFMKSNTSKPAIEWMADNELGGVCNHETRSHIEKDLWRYYFCAIFAKLHGRSPKLRDFPKALLPNHRNVSGEGVSSKFGDRFRVQISSEPSTTVVSHISKDGHYYIHYDPSQYRSLTVREAARLQTFPDNYFFEGPRTEQFKQVGNAVPPYLAFQVAAVVEELLSTNNKQ